MSKPPYTGNSNDNRKDNRNPMQTTQTLANERIRAPQVRLIDADGTNLGVVNTRDALFRARNAGLDLVAINPNANPMVAKMLDLGKFLYEQKKEQKERARRSRESGRHHQDGATARSCRRRAHQQFAARIRREDQSRHREVG